MCDDLHVLPERKTRHGVPFFYVRKAYNGKTFETLKEMKTEHKLNKTYENGHAAKGEDVLCVSPMNGPPPGAFEGFERVKPITPNRLCQSPNKKKRSDLSMSPAKSDGGVKGKNMSLFSVKPVRVESPIISKIKSSMLEEEHLTSPLIPLQGNIKKKIGLYCFNSSFYSNSSVIPYIHRSSYVLSHNRY